MFVQSYESHQKSDQLKKDPRKERANQGEENEGQITKDRVGVTDVNMGEDGERKSGEANLGCEKRVIR